MKILDRYILREMIAPFLAGSIALVLMFQANFLIFLLKTYSVSNIPVLALLQLIAYKTPEFLRMTLPSAIALSSSLVITRITRESELTAMRSAGAPIRRVIMPVAIFGLLTAGLSFLLMERIQPIAEGKFKEVSEKALMLAGAPEFVQNIFFKAGPRTMVYFASAQRLPDDKTLVRDFVMVEQLQMGKTAVVTADEGTLDKGVWVFKNMYHRILVGKRLISFRGITTIDQKISVQDLFATPQQTEMNTNDLRHHIAAERGAGRDTRRLETELWSRYSIPVACFVFAIVGPILAVVFGKTGGYVGLLLAVMLLWAYFNVYIISTEIFGKNGWLSPFFAAWFPNLLFGALGLLGIRRLE